MSGTAPAFQNIPLGGVGRPDAVRRSPVRGAATGLVAAWPLVAAAAAVGWFLGSSPAPFRVMMTTTTFSVGQVRLDRVGPGLYSGPQGALVVEGTPSGTLAAGSTVLHGVPMSGRCTIPPSGTREFCQFRLGGAELSAADSRGTDGWVRRYADGQVVAISFPGRRPVPVPFALGR